MKKVPIDLYASTEMEQTIAKQKAMMNRFAHMPGNDERELTAHFKRSCYYEWQFWEMAWTCQDWLQDVKNLVNNEVIKTDYYA